MFSTAQQSFLDNFIPVLYERYGKDMSYIAYTNSNTTSIYDLTVIVSSKPISTVDGYSYTVQRDSTIMYTISTRAYSSGYNADNSKRILQSTYTSNTVNIPVYDFIYTNADYHTDSLVCQPDLLTEVARNEKQTQLNYIVCIFACTILLYTFFRHFFRRR